MTVQPATAAHYYEQGWWDDSTLTSHLDHWADTQPDHPYVSDGNAAYTYGEFRDASRALSAALVGLGARPGDRIAVQLANWTEFFLIYAANARAGIVTIPVVPVYREKEVRHIVADSGAVGLVTAGVFRGFDHAAMAASIAASVPGLQFRIVVRGAGDMSTGDPTDGAVAFEDLLAAPGDLPAAPGADDRHVILYSSGTEADAKGCLHTWNSASFLPKQAVAALGMTTEDVMFMPSPVTHALGLTLGLMAPTVAGAAVHLLDVFDPAVALQRIDEYGCTGTASPAPFIRMMLDAFDPAQHDVSRLRFWLSAGAAIPGSLVTEAADRFSGCRVVSAYGSSEVMMATICRPEDSVERVASSDGAPVPGVEIRIVGVEEDEAPTGESGEIRYRGPGRLVEYWNNPELTAAATDAQGWWRTGDLGKLDDEGYLRVTGRLKDIIIRGGFNISAREVEEALLTHPAVLDVAVVGLPDPTLGERACAVVRLRPGATIDLADLKEFLSGQHNLAVWKVPERIEVVDEFPTTATGKIKKFALRNRYGA